MAKRQPVSIPMEDEITHTVEQPICNDPTCICAQAEYDLLIASQKRKPKRHHTTLVERHNEAALSPINRPFSLLKQ